MELSRKAQRIEASVTLAITAKAKEMKENGVDVISFGAGEPDFNTPENIINAAIKAMQEGNTKYTNVNGILPLREVICKKFKEDNSLVYKPSQIVVSTGAKQSLANVFLAILNPGDEVIVPNPYWVSYPELIRLADGKPVFVESDETSSYKFTKENLEKAVTEKTKAIILNTPNNPTGTIYNREELIEIAEFAKRYDLIIVSDEMYEKLIYDGESHVSIASVSDDAYERTIVINGLSKSYAMIFVESDETSSYKFTKENLEKAVTEKTKAIILNTPNNPTGTIYNREELIEIAEFAKRYDLIIVSDEMYEKLIYDGESHVSIASVSDDAYERTIVINGLSKSYAMTGWRLGYCGASEKIAKLMTNIQSHMTSNVCSITQYAAVEALNGPQDKVKEMISEFERRRNYMAKTLEEMNNLSIIKPQGAFYIMINIDKCLGKEINGEKINDSMDFSAKLLESEKVAVIPGKAFGLDNYVRVSYATSMELIEKGLERINKFVNKLK